VCAWQTRVSSAEAADIFEIEKAKGCFAFKMLRTDGTLVSVGCALARARTRALTNTNAPSWVL
jgi:hypothetical protein